MPEKIPAKPAEENVVAQAGDATLIIQTGEQAEKTVQKAGERGPKSSLETKVGSTTGASAGEAANFEGNVVTADTSKSQNYSVQVHDDQNGVQVKYVSATSGDEAAQKVLASHGYRGASIRGVDVASAPDPNSMGGERDASIMIADAENTGNVINTLGTEANAKATKELRKADVKELGE